MTRQNPKNSIRPESDERDADEASRARIGGTDGCEHPRDARIYLGQMTTAAFFQCTVCDGVIVEW